MIMKTINMEGVKTVGLPKGDDRTACVRAFEETTGIEPPDFKKTEKLKILSQGLLFYSLKGKDLPGLVDRQRLDLAVTGSDSVLIYPRARQLVARPLGEAMCRFSILSKPEDKDEVLGMLRQHNPRRGSLEVVTSDPDLLEIASTISGVPVKPLPLPQNMTISGSVEIMSDLFDVKAMADRVNTARTAKENGKVEICSLLDIYPVSVQRRTEANLLGIDIMRSMPR